MDRLERTINITSALNLFNLGQIEPYKFMHKVCDYFDSIKGNTLQSHDKKLLIHLANKIGVPQYYDMLAQFNIQNDLSLTSEEISMQAISDLLYESSLVSYSSKLHKYQKQILDKFIKGKNNRFFLSASTSFGKTHLVYEIIQKMEYQNVVLIFPTIALLSENLEKVIDTKTYFKDNYKIHTLSEINEFGDRNLFIYTPERFLSFIEKNPNKINFNFAFIDEVYKIDNDYIINEETKENERDIAYRLAVFYSLKANVDVLLAGPYVEFSDKKSRNYNSSFDKFLELNNIKLINFNEYEIVDKTFNEIITPKEVKPDSELELTFEHNGKTKRLLEAVKQIVNAKQNVIVYCPDRGKRSGVEKYVSDLLSSNYFTDHNWENYSDIISHISKNFPADWIVLKSLKQGIGIHHGLIPKYIQKEIVSLFNIGRIHTLVSTTTITEGVNTSAKNLIVVKSQKGDKELKKFDAKNIAGRAGRFGYHYYGRVFTLDIKFLETIESNEIGIRHKNYDITANKKEIDLFYTDDQFLSEEDKYKKISIKEEQEKRGIPDEIISMFKVVSRRDKIFIYDQILKLSNDEHESLDKLIFSVTAYTNISFDGFQIILNIIRPIVQNTELQGFIDTMVLNKRKQREYSLLCSYVFAYLQGGFSGSIDYKMNIQHKDSDRAISETAKFVYNTLKYQVVKYLGVFNVMYKFRITQVTGRDFNSISGLDKLLLKFEYNALTDIGRIVSDYGVPSKVLDYFENENESRIIRDNFDEYENRIFEKVLNVINKN